MCPGQVLPCVQNPSKHSQVGTQAYGRTLLEASRGIAIPQYLSHLRYVGPTRTGGHYTGLTRKAPRIPKMISLASLQVITRLAPNCHMPENHLLLATSIMPSQKKTQNMKLLTVHHTESSCCQVKFGFSLLRTEIFGSCPNVSLLSATPPMSQFRLE